MKHKPDLPVERRCWDVVIVGTGMGGSTLGHALARSGFEVLFVEKGRSCREGDALTGDYAERFGSGADVLARAGRWSEEIDDVSRLHPRRFIPFIGSGTGGSTALYGMALERFLPSDFSGWPVSYEEMESGYQAAERLYRVHAPASLNPANQELFEHFEARGLHPYRLPMACAYERGDDRTQGFLDARGAKNDAARMCLEPALADYGARLIDRCEVVRLEATRREVTAVKCMHQGRPLILRARIVVLAAGALSTPSILLRSASPLWPEGLANDSGQVGRNLMRHFVDLYAVVPRLPGTLAGNLKQIAFRDFYHVDGQRLGAVQSFGELPPDEVILAELPRLLRPFVRGFIRRLRNRLILATLVEDLPYADNRLIPGKRTAFHYRIRREGAERIRAMRRRMASLLAPYRYTLLRQAEDNRRLAHVCGTCRMGENPKESVVDPGNRVHSLENLYVVDGSFFPSSGGTNPALTIAANALRIAKRLGAKSGAAAAAPARRSAHERR